MVVYPICQICGKEDGRVFVSGRLLCFKCNEKFRQKTEKNMNKLFDDIKNER